MNRKILSYDDVKDIPFGDRDEDLVSANAYDDDIVCEYKKFDMFAWTGFDILVRNSVARNLAEANKYLQTHYNLSLKVVYGYRSPEVQTKYFEVRYEELKRENPSMDDAGLRRLTHNFVAMPDAAGHTLGAAIDVTLVDDHGKECDMGTKVADYTDPVAIQTFATVSEKQATFRNMLLAAMTEAGFAPFLGEWWHYSYGDKEWAAYYGYEKALYAPITVPKKTKVCIIAGGNRTALQICRTWKGPDAHLTACQSLMQLFPGLDQAGIYYEDTNKLEMAGGEFCGNATAAVASLLSNGQEIEYGVSGFSGAVSARTERLRHGTKVTVNFRSMFYAITQKELLGESVAVVEFEGITHVLIKGDLPGEYTQKATEVRQMTKLSKRDAVGVIWYTLVNNRTVRVNPVVWVRKIDTLFYESSCGSGAIAAALVLNVENIVQPTGKTIRVNMLDEDTIRTTSNVRLV